MRREESGSYQLTTAGGERVRAFVPAPLPPSPALRMHGPMQQALESAVLALGRLDSITMLLCHANVLEQPLLYLSLYLKQHRNTYSELLNRVRRTGDWESWLAFFLEGVRITAESAVNAAQRLSAMFQNDRMRAQAASGRRAGSVLRVHDALKSQPILSLPAACRQAALSFPAASAAMKVLAANGIVREITGKRRNRLFVYEQYVSILNEKTGNS